MMKKKLFTLIEIIIVVMILSLLMSLLFPVYANIRRSSKKIVSISNIKQFITGFRMYVNDYEIVDDYVRREQVENYIDAKICCDPFDVWRSNCKEDLTSPFLGSYIVTCDVMSRYDSSADEFSWQSYRDGKHDNPTWALNFFYSDRKLMKFQGNYIDSKKCLADINTCRIPDMTIRAYTDGSVSVTKENPGEKELMVSWRDVITRDMFQAK